MSDKVFAEVIFDIFTEDFELCGGHGVDSAERGRSAGLERDSMVVGAMGR
jgi:hypothetical protein